MAVEAAEADQETSLPEENHEVDPSITLHHKVFQLCHPTLCKGDVAALADEVKQTVLDRGERAECGSVCGGVKLRRRPRGLE
jgi:hypothetical protein